MHVLVTWKKRWRHRFPHYKSMGAFCCHGIQSFDPICSKTLCSLSPTPVMLHIKFDQDWPTGFRDIQVWKCGRWTTDRLTDDGPLVYYKLTLWAFGSGELIIRTHKNLLALSLKLNNVVLPQSYASKDADKVANTVDPLFPENRSPSQNFSMVKNFSRM